jgi:hypothetical protein
MSDDGRAVDMPGHDERPSPVESGRSLVPILASLDEKEARRRLFLIRMIASKSFVPVFVVIFTSQVIALSLAVAAVFLLLPIRTEGPVFAIGVGVATFLGVVISVLRQWQRTEAKEESSNNRVASAMFLQRMASLETAARSFVAAQQPNVSERIGLRSILSYLLVMEVWDDADVRSFRRLLTTRNALVHGEAVDIPEDQARSGIEETNRLMGLIHSASSAARPEYHRR